MSMMIFKVEIYLSDSNVPKSHKDKVIGIHPSAMQLCGLTIGKPCVVNDCMVLTAWPLKSSSVSSLTVSNTLLTKLGSKKGGNLSVRRLWIDYEEAAEIHLKTS